MKYRIRYQIVKLSAVRQYYEAKLFSLRDELGGDRSIQVGVLGGLLGECAAEGEDGFPDPLDDVGGVDVEVGLVRRHGEHPEPAALRGVVRPGAAASATAASSSSGLGREGICLKMPPQPGQSARSDEKREGHGRRGREI